MHCGGPPQVWEGRRLTLCPLCCAAGGLQRISGSENYGGRMGSLGPWTPPNLASMSDMGAGANLALQPLMSLNNLLKLGRCGLALASAQQGRAA